MAIPGVGVFNVHDGIVAVAFEEALSAQSNIATNKNRINDKMGFMIYT